MAANSWAGRGCARGEGSSRLQTTGVITVRIVLMRAFLAVGMGVAVSAGAARAAGSVPFPDVPPWHWASDAVLNDRAAGLVVGYPAASGDLAQNAVLQVFDGFAHAGARGAQEWIERFSFNRPATWPAPLQRSEVAQIAFNEMRVFVRGDAATVTFAATVTTRQGRPVTSPMRVEVRHTGQDWQVDYASLAAGSPLFR